METKNFVVFYSWQNDSPKKTNRAAIAAALESAGLALQADLTDRDLGLRIDEATRNEPGRPNIPQRILEKIDGCDVFVCDVTTINAEAKDLKEDAESERAARNLRTRRLAWKRMARQRRDAALCAHRLVRFRPKLFGWSVELPWDGEWPHTQLSVGHRAVGAVRLNK